MLAASRIVFTRPTPSKGWDRTQRRRGPTAAARVHNAASGGPTVTVGWDRRRSRLTAADSRHPPDHPRTADLFKTGHGPARSLRPMDNVFAAGDRFLLSQARLLER